MKKSPPCIHVLEYALIDSLTGAIECYKMIHIYINWVFVSLLNEMFFNLVKSNPMFLK